ncbi:tetratricopeptide repeat protein [Flavobacterium sp. XS2P14]|uniref:tetratricopeptide repeat protein n=1 Tax=Flavobacterium sp. XS2P14 TaxID=3401735 RepID=UPI003AAEDA8C
MLKTLERPIIKRFNETDWEFINPESYDNEIVADEFWKAVEILDYDDQRAEDVFKKLIEKHPFYIDAYVHLSIAFRNQKKTFESLLTAEKAYTISRECLPKEFNSKKHKIIWSWLENRPFLRAYLNYALESIEHKNYEIAISVLKDILNFNENDNQGIRYTLLETYLKLKNFDEAKKIIKKYKDDFSIEFKFGEVVLTVLDGNTKKADILLKEAIQTNKFFIDEIKKEKHIKPAPYRIPGEPFFDAGIPIDSVQQAYEYWSRNKDLYKNKKIIEYFKYK